MLLLSQGDKLMEDKILATFKKHLSGIDELQTNVSKSQIYNFGENMKGVNEFIGAVQMLGINLSKIKNLFEKIAWIDDLLKQESNTNTSQMLHTERQTHIVNIEHIVQNAKFMGIGLFDTELSCVVNGIAFSVNIANPLLSDDGLEYCTNKQEELNQILSQISQALNNDEAIYTQNRGLQDSSYKRYNKDF